MEWTGTTSAAELFRLANEKTKYAELTANLHQLERQKKKKKKEEEVQFIKLYQYQMYAAVFA